MSSCLINNIYTISILNECKIGLAGIKKIWISPFRDEIFSQLSISNNLIVDAPSSLRFAELDFDKTTSNYSEKFNYDTRKYEITVNLQIPIFETNKRSAIDSLIKANLIFLIQDANNKYFLVGEKTGIKSTDYNATTDVFKTGKTVYNFVFTAQSDYSSYGVDINLIEYLLSVDCDEFFEANALTSELYWIRYAECIIEGLDPI